MTWQRYIKFRENPRFRQNILRIGQFFLLSVICNILLLRTSQQADRLSKRVGIRADISVSCCVDDIMEAFPYVYMLQVTQRSMGTSETHENAHNGAWWGHHTPRRSIYPEHKGKSRDSLFYRVLLLSGEPIVSHLKYGARLLGPTPS